MSFGQLRPGAVLRIHTDQPIQVTHSIAGRSLSVNAIYHSAYTLIPAVQQYANSYSFQVHGSVQLTLLVTTTSL